MALGLVLPPLRRALTLPFTSLVAPRAASMSPGAILTPAVCRSWLLPALLVSGPRLAFVVPAEVESAPVAAVASACAAAEAAKAAKSAADAVACGAGAAVSAAAATFGHAFDFLRPRKFSVRLDVKMKRGAAPYPRNPNRKRPIPQVKGILHKLLD
eukprot:TRINITY_DN46475_c0_g1_i1.p1 TRINITY_DN46475_c0_g1~~TRINITY_DN46475_c0_g1_i1.p1  ORF type:complete len:176 (-),score=27.85 TRINITY_DN46475_c0_g1_i1:74-541(-)